PADDVRSKAYVGGTRCAETGALLGDVADAGRRPADCRRGRWKMPAGPLVALVDRARVAIARTRPTVSTREAPADPVMTAENGTGTALLTWRAVTKLRECAPIRQQCAKDDGR